jgi:hypothetical protein
MAVSFASTFYTRDRITVTDPQASPQDPATLGPMFTLEWRLRASSSLFRELTFYTFDRYRTQYSRGGERVDGTNGNELELGAEGLLPLNSGVSFVAGVHGRHNTGLSVDNTLATAAVASGGVDIGLAWRTGPLIFRPTIGGEVGRLDSGGQKLTIHKLQALFTITSR